MAHHNKGRPLNRRISQIAEPPVTPAPGISRLQACYINRIGPSICVGIFGSACRCSARCVERKVDRGALVKRTIRSRSGVARMSTFIESGIPFEDGSWLAS